MQLEENCPIPNTFGLPARARYGITVARSIDWPGALATAATLQPSLSRELLIVGGGSNLVFKSDYDGVVIFARSTGNMQLDSRRILVAAGESWHDFVLSALREVHTGLENLAYIPGSVGAAPIQNIGAYGVEVASLIESVHSIHRSSGQTIIRSAADCQFGYRESVFKHAAKEEVICHVVFNLKPSAPNLNYADIQARCVAEHINEPSPAQLCDWVTEIRQRKLPNPKTVGNVGSFFKNPVLNATQANDLQHLKVPLFAQTDGGYKSSAAYLIDQAGLKGLSVGGAAVSEQHALVLENKNKASGQDVWQLACLVQERVFDRFGISLAIEPNFI
jgi:UDP-N-acetylmuramate dehydrogenase